MTWHAVVADQASSGMPRASQKSLVAASSTRVAASVKTTAAACAALVDEAYTCVTQVRCEQFWGDAPAPTCYERLESDEFFAELEVACPAEVTLALFATGVIDLFGP